MMQRLAIGLIDSEPVWEELLRQIGLSFERVDWSAVGADRYAAIIVNRSLSRTEHEKIRAYMHNGGALLDCEHYARRERIATVTRSVSSLPGGDTPFESIWLVDVDDRVQPLGAADRLGGTVALIEHGGGWLAHVPFDIVDALRSSRSKRRRFYSSMGHHPDEVVASATKSAYGDLIEGCLRWLHERRRLPLVTLWHFPRSEQSLFAFRIDSDYGTPHDMLRLRDLANRHAIPLSIFLHVGAHCNELDMFRSFVGHELGLHGFRHRTFDTHEANWANIAEAQQVTRQAGIETAGFAAPTGRWNTALDRALRDLGIEYSSEFALDYDGLPFHPWTGSSCSPVLQVPIHPISVGNLTRAHAGREEIARYYHDVMMRLHSRRMPVILYHHPLQDMWDVIESIFVHARSLSMAVTTTGEYARWWKHRHRARFDCAIVDGSLRVNMVVAASDISLRVCHDGREAFVGPGAHALEELRWTALPQPMRPPSDLLAIRRTTPTMLRHSLEDAVSRFRQ